MGSHILSVNLSVKLLFVSHDCLGVDSLVVKANQILDVSSSIGMAEGRLISDGDGVRLDMGRVSTRVFEDFLEVTTDTSLFVD